jgi:hypothetical protein
MDELDKKIKKIWNKVKKPAAVKGKENCPGDNVLSYYTDGILKEADKEKVEQHLLQCKDCLEMILLQNKVRQGEALEAVPEAPSSWMEKAMDLVPAKDARDGVFDIVLKFARETIEIITNPGNLLISYDAVPLPVRGERKKLPANFVNLSKTFSDIKCDIEVEKVADRHVNLKIITRDIKSELPAERLRISLFNPRKEIASFIAKKGDAHFEGLRFGEYVIKVNRQGKQIGRVSLEIKE